MYQMNKELLNEIPHLEIGTLCTLSFSPHTVVTYLGPTQEKIPASIKENKEWQARARKEGEDTTYIVPFSTLIPKKIWVPKDGEWVAYCPISYTEEAPILFAKYISNRYHLWKYYTIFRIPPTLPKECVSVGWWLANAERYVR